MVQKVDTPLPQTTQMPHWFWQVYTRINSDVIDGPITINAPSSGVPLTVAAISGASGITITGSFASAVYQTIENTGNTSGVATALLLTVGGSSADDPYIRWTVASATDWSIGIDNSDSDKLKIKPTTSPSGGTACSIELTTTGNSAAFSRDGTNGYTRISKGDSTHTGYIEWMRGDDTRAGYMGFATGTGSDAGVVELGAGLYVFLGGPIRTHTTTVGSLMAAATAGAGARDFVTDATATTFASVVAGGGTNGVPVYSDGTNWLIG